MAERRLHVLHLVGTSHAGGTERFLADLAARHTADGIRTSIVVLDAPGPLADDYRRAAADVEHLEAGAGADRRQRAIRVIGRHRSGHRNVSREQDRDLADAFAR